MNNIVNISVYDLSTMIAEKYTKLGVFSSSDGVTFSEITLSSTRVVLNVNTEYYQYIHTSNSDISNTTYKIKAYKASGTPATSFTTLDGWYSDQSDLTEDLRYAIEDVDKDNQRYTIKELRRFVKKAINTLQSTNYMRRFKTSFDGIISPIFNNQDKAIILLQALIEVNISQLLRAADTNISFNDGRGSTNIRTHEALKTNIKFLIEERDVLIKTANGLLEGAVVVDVGSKAPLIVVRSMNRYSRYNR